MIPPRYCWHCNAEVKLVRDGWICWHCGENGENIEMVDTLSDAVIKKRPLRAPLDPPNP